MARAAGLKKIFNVVVFNFSIFAILFGVVELTSNVVSYVKYKKLGWPFYLLEESLKSRSSQVVYTSPWDEANQSYRPGVYQSPYGFTYRINNIGFRGDDVNLIEKKKLRILCFGGSTTIGLESQDDKTFPATIEKILKNQGIDAEVINLGASAKSLSFISSIFERYIDLLKPDMAIIYSNRNTALYDGSRAWAKVESLRSQPTKFWMAKIYQKLQQYSATASLIHQLSLPGINRSRVPAQWSKDYARMYLGEVGGETDFDLQFLRSGYTAMIEPLVKIANSKNLKLIVATQTMMLDNDMQVKTRSEDFESLATRMQNDPGVLYNKTNNEIDANVWTLTGAAINRQILGLSKIYPEVTVSDVDQHFLKLEDKKNFFVDYLHLTEAGNAEVAKVLSKTIVSVLGEHALATDSH